MSLGVKIDNENTHLINSLVPRTLLVLYPKSCQGKVKFTGLRPTKMAVQPQDECEKP